MRFSLIATGAAAAISIPLALAAGAPEMSGDQFLTAVRCAAYEQATGDIAPATRLRLNAEARRQPAETAARAQSEAEAIALQAVNIQTVADAAMMSRERSAACSDVRFAVGANGADAG